jgi:hypothetical protein
MLEQITMRRARGYLEIAIRAWKVHGWLMAGLIWILVCFSIQTVVTEIHVRTSGAYNSPDKVAVRKAIAAANIIGAIVLLVPGMIKAVRGSDAAQRSRNNRR